MDLNWVLIIVIAVFVELVIRFFTRKMEDKRKREKALASSWMVLAVVLVVAWFIVK